MPSREHAGNGMPCTPRQESADRTADRARLDGGEVEPGVDLVEQGGQQGLGRGPAVRGHGQVRPRKWSPVSGGRAVPGCVVPADARKVPCGVRSRTIAPGTRSFLAVRSTAAWRTAGRIGFSGDGMRLGAGEGIVGAGVGLGDGAASAAASAGPGRAAPAAIRKATQGASRAVRRRAVSAGWAVPGPRPLPRGPSGVVSTARQGPMRASQPLRPAARYRRTARRVPACPLRPGQNHPILSVSGRAGRVSGGGQA